MWGGQAETRGAACPGREPLRGRGWPAGPIGLKPWGAAEGKPPESFQNARSGEAQVLGCSSRLGVGPQTRPEPGAALCPVRPARDGASQCPQAPWGGGAGMDGREAGEVGERGVEAPWCTWASDEVSVTSLFMGHPCG